MTDEEVLDYAKALPATWMADTAGWPLRSRVILFAVAVRSGKVSPDLAQIAASFRDVDPGLLTEAGSLAATILLPKRQLTAGEFMRNKMELAMQMRRAYQMRHKATFL